METVKRFRLMVTQSSVALTLLFALIAFAFSREAAQGVALGGVAGALMFWIESIRMEKLASGSAQKVKSVAFQLSVFRMGIFGLVLYKAYTLDPVVGFAAAVGGLFITRLVVVFFAFTGLDLKRDIE